MVHKEDDKKNLEALLAKWKQGNEDGNKQVCDEVVAILYQELRQIASATLRKNIRNPLLQTTALVNEAYIRLRKIDGLNTDDKHSNTKKAFLALASKIVFGVLVDYIRKENIKVFVPISTILDETNKGNTGGEFRQVDLLILHEAMEKLQRDYSDHVKVIEQVLMGYTLEEIAEIMDFEVNKVRNLWNYGKALLGREIDKKTIKTNLKP